MALTWQLGLQQREQKTFAFAGGDPSGCQTVVLKKLEELEEVESPVLVVEYSGLQADCLTQELVERLGFVADVVEK